MPRFSVIVPANQVQAYLTACPESVLSQSYEDLELIALDDREAYEDLELIAVHDREAYEAARGTYFDLRSFAPGAVARGEDELTDIFATGHWRGSRSTQLRSAFRERLCPYDDGRAAERVVRHVVLGETELPPVIPLAERHPVPSAAAASERSPLTTVPRPGTETTITDNLQEGATMPSSPSHPTPTRPSTWRPAGRPGT